MLVLNKIKQVLINYWNDKPLLSIIILGLIVRLIAIIFSSGFAMQDDHFLIIETSWAWANDYVYNHWMPWDQDTENPIPEGHSLFYVGLHYLYFELANILNIQNPKLQMLGIRFFHGVFSLLIVFFSYKITLKLSSKKTAKIVGISLALGWAMPFYGVRNLVELVCIPPFLAGIWVLVKHDFKEKWKYYILAGILFGIAFSVRLQMAVFYGAFGLCLLFMKKWKGSIGLILGFIVGAFFSQGIIDYYIWGKPFAELIEYINYNSSDAMYDYGGTWKWHKYIIVLVFFTIPIIGLFWLFGLFTTFKKYFWLLIPFVVFLIFHTLYPNQQERFIFPMIPIFVILGAIGWENFRQNRVFWTKHTKLWKRILIFGWSLNILILIGASTYATKMSKVDSAYYFYSRHNNQPLVIMQDDSYGKEPWYEGGASLFPKYYTGNGQIYSYIINTEERRKSWANNFDLYQSIKPDYILLSGTKYINKRLDYYYQFFPRMNIQAIFPSSKIDQFLHYMNPKNRNEQIIVVKTNK